MKKTLYSCFLMLWLIGGNIFIAEAQIGDCDNVADLITNGNFSAGNTGFGSGGLTFATTTGCSTSPCCNTEEYFIGTNYNDKCSAKPGFTGDGNFMIIDGYSSGATFQDFYTNTVNVVAGTTYEITFWLRDAYGVAVSNFGVDVYVGGSFLGSTGEFANAWNDFTFNWTAPASGNVTLALQINGNSYRDFALDSVSFEYCLIEDCEVSSVAEYEFDSETCTFRFYDLSSAGNGSTTIVGRYWEFGDGSTSTDQNPSHFYSNPGVYEVCLTTYGINSEGECCSDQFCFEIENEDCSRECNVQADFEATAVSSCVYAFSSTSFSATPVVGYFWEFHDGTTSTDPNPSFTYNNAGSYTVCLTIVSYGPDGQCCLDRICKEIGTEGNCESNPQDSKIIPERNNTSVNSLPRSLEIYPNPAGEQVNVVLKNDSPWEEKGSVVMIDASGKKVKNVSGQHDFVRGENRLNIDTSDLNEGLYVISVELNGYVYMERVIISR